MRLRHAFLTLFAAVLLGGGAGYLWLQHSLSAPGPLLEDRIIYIAPGSSTGEIAAELYFDGAISSPFLFGYGAKRGAGVLKAGEYLVPAHAALNEIVALLRSGKLYQRHLTIAEGLTSAEIVELVNNAEALEGKVDKAPPEGSLLPETYNYTRGETRGALLARMQKAMQAGLDELWPNRAEGLPLATPEQAVTLASIVEKETGVAAERPRIAGVFYNRLKAGMPLQSDPTVIYAITDGKFRLSRPLLRDDLNDASPYNTYAAPGLPPGPIANPGKAALEAVLAPEQNDYFYFVADGTGGHAFAKSLGEHRANVARWRDIEKRKQP